MIDQHDPDFLYFDNSLFLLGWGGMNIGSYFYNQNLQTHGGSMEAVVNVKQVPDNFAKAVVADYERGITSKIMPYPWQSERVSETGTTTANCTSSQESTEATCRQRT